MHETTINILKILYETKITKQNLAQNLKLKENTITKSVMEINNFLEYLKLNKILIKDKKLQLDLTKRQWNKLFNSLNSLTFEEKVDYLYIKFVYFKFLNLEKERIILNISRSSIDRCFFVVKNLLEKNGSKFGYNKEKMNILIDLSEYNRKIFIIKLTKLIIEENILISSQRELLNSMKQFVVKMRITKLIIISKCLKIPVTITQLSFLCALDIYANCFKDIKKSHLKIEETEILKKIKLVVNCIGFSFTKEYKEFLIFYIYKISLNQHIYIEEIYSKANTISNKIMIKFGIDDEMFKNNFIEYLYSGILKKENNIFKVKNIIFYDNEKKFLDILDNILSECEISLYVCDKYRLIYLLKNKVIDININNINKVLILLQEITPSRQLTLKQELEKYFKNIEFDIEYDFLNNRSVKNIKNYDYVINDSNINLEIGDIFDRINFELETLIIDNLIRDIHKRYL
ncbi:hypothetical protein [Cetobacterium sp.]|uniref:hypothetical protein n=3 Tax=Cetobacterium sp. TaxID=2071632 RepID=UPI003F31DC7B